MGLGCHVERLVWRGEAEGWAGAAGWATKNDTDCARSGSARQLRGQGMPCAYLCFRLLFLLPCAQLTAGVEWAGRLVRRLLQAGTLRLYLGDRLHKTRGG